MKNRGEGSNTAIVAIVVLVLVGIFAFFLLNGGVGGDDTDINVDMSKPAEAVGDAAKGMGDAAKEAAPDAPAGQ